MIKAISPAKINLYLRVLGKNSNNYHLLHSMVAFTDDIFDIITLEPSTNYHLKITGPNAHLLSMENNIISHAINTFCELTRKETKFKITLTKNLPIAAGIGGGSGNAATIIKMLQQFFQLWLEPDDLAQLLIGLGADVPVCYHNRACYFEGIGEIITPIQSFPDLWVVLINPGIAIHSATIFKMGFEQIYPHPIPKVSDFATSKDIVQFLLTQDNDLYHNSKSIAPSLSTLIKKIGSQAGCQYARMSGSGSTCFGLFSDSLLALQAANELKKQCPNFYIATSKLH